MNSIEYLAYLRELGVSLRAGNSEVVVSGPRDALTPRLLQEIGERKSELLPLLPQTIDKRALPLHRVPRDVTFPLSFAQQRLWFLNQLDPDQPFYHIPEAFYLSGPLDIDALRRSLDEIVRRHEVLRTVIATEDGRPVQVIKPAALVKLLLADVSNATPDLRDLEMRQVVRAARRQPFDLSQDPMLRAGLVRIDDNEHVLHVTMHHIASDGWSMDVFWRELSLLYRAFCLDQPSPLSDLPVQYADFAVWQRQRLQGEELERQLRYWRRQLEGASTVLDLPGQASVDGGYAASRNELRLPYVLTEALHNLARQEGCTVFMTLLAAFKVLLSRYTQQTDIVIGTVIANRNHPAIQDLIGFFVNTLVLRSQLSDSTFRQVLAGIRKVVLEAHEHQDIPFEKLVEELRPERDISHSPLFEAMFTYTPGDQLPRNLDGVAITPVQGMGGGSAKFPLSLAVRERPLGLEAVLSYQKARFDEDTIGRFLDHFRVLLEGIVADPDQKVSALPLLCAEERRTFLTTWNDTAADFDDDICLHQMFEVHVRRTPHAIALISGGTTLTYGQLNQRANQVANYLRSVGVGPEIPVAVWDYGTVDFVIGMLGVLKAGGVHVPVDADLPLERVRFILADTGAPVLLARRRLLAALPDAPSLGICFDAENPLFAACSDLDPANLTDSNNAAYVIYTSGSSGRPKGVIIQHRSICNYQYFKQAEDIDRSGERHLFSGSVGFDVAMSQICGPLVSGAQLVLAPPEARYDPYVLMAEYSRWRPAFVGPSPAVLGQLVALPEFEAGDYLRIIVTGAEIVPPTLVNRILSTLDVRLINAYGPTEVTITSSMHECHRDGYPSNVPIGKPVANTTAYVLDQNLQLVPVGVPGELYLGGAQLARGYYGAPKLTAEKFLPNPFSCDPGSRLYRTGDLVRWLPNGELDFLGRRDYQVKVRGQRVELGEIESNLLRHPDVKQAAVLVRGDNDAKRLVAYLTPHVGASPTSVALRSFLEVVLPAYMVPAQYVFLDSLPLNNSDKVDRKALAELPVAPVAEVEFKAPQTATEIAIASVWSDLLGIEAIGIHDDFFGLGGHSLLAAQMVHRLRQDFESDLPLRRLFETPTIAGLAAYIAEQCAGKATDASNSTQFLVPLRPTGSFPPLFLLAGGGGSEIEYLTAYAGLIHHLGPDQPVYGFQAQGRVQGADLLHDSLAGMAASFVADLRMIQPRGPYFLGGECIGAKVALEMARQLQDDNQQVGGLFLLNAVVRGTAERASTTARPHVAHQSGLGLRSLSRALRSRAHQVRSLPAHERVPRLRNMVSNATSVLLPLTNQQREQKSWRAARLGYMALLQSHRPEPYAGDVVLLMTDDLIARGYAEAWQPLVSGRLTVVPLAGVHRTYLGEHVDTNAARLLACLTQTHSNMTL